MSALSQIIVQLTTTLTLGTAPAPVADMPEPLLTLSIPLERSVAVTTTVPSLAELPAGWALTADGRYAPAELSSDALDAFSTELIARDEARRTDVTARIDPLED